MNNPFLENFVWAQSKPRDIDSETILDLLMLLEYQVTRSAVFEDLGLSDHGSPIEQLYDYVLDALGVPPEGHQIVLAGEHKSFTKDCEFSREWFYKLFYSGFLLDEDEKISHEDLVDKIKNEVSTNLKKHYV